MVRRSYLQRIAGDGQTPMRLSPPRVLFRPAPLPIEATTGLDMTAATRKPTEPLTVTPSRRRGPAPVVAPAQAASETHPAGGAGRAGPAPHATAALGCRDTGLTDRLTATPGSIHRQSPLAAVGPPSRPAEKEAAEDVRPAVSGSRSSPRAVAGDAPGSQTSELASHVPSRPVATSEPLGMMVARVPAEPPEETPVLLARPGTPKAPRSMTADPVPDEPLGGTPVLLPRPGEPKAAGGMTKGPVPTDSHTDRPRLGPIDPDDARMPRLGPVVANRDESTAGAARGVERPRAAGPVLSPIRLEPSAVAPRQHGPDNRERTAGVRIGSLEVRIMPPAAAAAPAVPPKVKTVPPPRSPPASPSAAPLSRGFRNFGLVQG